MPTAFTSGADEKVSKAYRELLSRLQAMLTTLVRALLTLASSSSLRRLSP